VRDGAAVALRLGDGDAVGLGLGAGLGDAAGGGVGAAVGGSVGAAVGAGVGVGRAVVATGPITMIVPLIEGWIEQWYPYMPAAPNEIVLFPDAGIGPVSNAPVSDVAVCVSGSLLIQVMASPTLIVTDCGM